MFQRVDIFDDTTSIAFIRLVKRPSLILLRQEINDVLSREPYTRICVE